MIDRAGRALAVHHRADGNFGRAAGAGVGLPLDQLRQLPHFERPRVGDAEPSDGADLVHSHRRVRPDGHDKLVRLRLAGGVERGFCVDAGVGEAQFREVVQVRTGDGHFGKCSLLRARWEDREQSRGGQVGAHRRRRADQRQNYDQPLPRPS